MLKYLHLSKLHFFTHISTFVIALLFCAFALTACNSGTEKAPDVSHIVVKLDPRRFDKDLAALDTNHLAAGLQQLKAKYPDFLDFYLDTLMGLGIHGNYNDTVDAIHTGLKTYLTYKDYKGLLDTIAKHYPNVDVANEQLVKGFKYLQNYYPKYEIPRIIYSVFWLNKLPAFLETNGNIGINLDMFLGGAYPYYSSVGIDNYMYKHMEPSFMQVFVFMLICDDMYPFRFDNRNLLDMMIQRGKQQYFLSKVLPDLDDTMRLAYSKVQLDGCEKNKAQIYNYFVASNLFYETNMQRAFRYVNDGPNTKEISLDCPGNIGTWLGYQIVKSYMKEHPSTTLPDLFKQTDPQKFLQESKYNPR